MGEALTIALGAAIIVGVLGGLTWVVWRDRSNDA